MSAPDLDICCQIDPQFGEFTENDPMGCDTAVFQGLFCNGTGEPCLIEGAPCIFPEVGTCTAEYLNTAGAATWEVTTPTYGFTRNGDGTVTIDFTISAIGCDNALPGTGSADPVPGDYIKAYIFFYVNADGLYVPDTVCSVTNMTGGGEGTLTGVTYEATGDAFTGLDCSLSYSTTFDNAGWDGRVCQAGIQITAYLKGFHSDNSPADFCIANPAGPTANAVELHAQVAGSCCSHTLVVP